MGKCISQSINNTPRFPKTIHDISFGNWKFSLLDMLTVPVHMNPFWFIKQLVHTQSVRLDSKTWVSWEIMQQAGVVGRSNEGLTWIKIWGPIGVQCLSLIGLFKKKLFEHVWS